MNLIDKAYADWINPISIGATSSVDGIETVGGLINMVISWLSLIVGVLAFFYLVYAGIIYITANGNPDQAKKGQQGIVNAVIGVIVAVLAYTILVVANNLASGGSVVS